MASLPTSRAYGKRIVCHARARTIAALVVIALASGVVLTGLSQDLEGRCSLVWSEGGLMWALKASPQ